MIFFLILDLLQSLPLHSRKHLVTIFVVRLNFDNNAQVQ
jgi:hypothetical protein